MSRGERWIAAARSARGDPRAQRESRDPDDVAGFLEDAAHYPGGHAPAVSFPETEAAVATLLRAAPRVLAVGTQTSLTGGATPFGDTVLSTRRMNGTSAWARDAVVVGPGVVLSDLEQELKARGLYYPPLPTYDGATVGGTVATNAAGAATFKYGTTRDWVTAITVVLAAGDVLDLRRGEVIASDEGHFEIIGTSGVTYRVDVPQYRMPEVPKISAGYYARPAMDLIDLFIGSEGTLGVVTAVELRLVSERPAWFVALVPVDDDAAAVRLVAELRVASAETWRTRDPAGVDVAAIEYMDARCLELLREDGTDARLHVGLPRDMRAAVLLQAELPPATTEAEAYEQLARGADHSRETPLTRLCRILDRHGVLDTTIAALPGDLGKRGTLFALREAVPVAVNQRVGIAQRTVDPAISKSGGDVIVPFGRLEEALAGYRSILEGHHLDHAIWGHISDGNVHPNVIPRVSHDVQRARAAQLAIGRLAIDLGGAPMSEHGTGRNPVKKELLRLLYGEDGIAAMRRVKRTLDPRGVLAPGIMFD